MTPKVCNKIFIILFLGLLTVSAFIVRLQNFKNSKFREIDESVYYSMATQVVEEGLSGYHTIPYGQHLAAKGRDVPEYFFQPLFKHPPVFTFLAAVSMKIFGVNPTSAEYVSLLLGVLMIPMIYFLGAQIFGKTVGVLSALFLWQDPANIICSQKVCADTTIAFFTLLSALCFVWGLKHKRDWFFVLSGVASGMAANTKYTGIFVSLAIVLYCLFCRKDLYANKKFQVSLALPFFMLAPWLWWNYKIYGVAAALKHTELKQVITKVVANLPTIALFLILFFLLRLAVKFFQSRFSEGKDVLAGFKQRQNFVSFLRAFIPLAFFMLVVPKHFLHSLQFAYLPTHTWQRGVISGASPLFYFGRLLELSPIYIFSLWKIFLYDPTEKKEALFLRLCAIVILFFFVFWGNYQTRYILSSLPFLILLGAKLWMDFYEKISASENVLICRGGRMFLRLVLVYIVLKSYYLNATFSFPNNMAYF